MATAGKYFLQLLLFRAGNNLMDLAFPTAALMFRGHRHLEHADGNEVGVVQLVQSPAVQLLGGGNADSVQLSSRLRPGSTANSDLEQRPGALMKETMNCWYFLEPSAAGAELAYLCALHPAAVVFVTVRQPCEAARIGQD